MRKTTSGFTIVEVLIVVTIIGILTAVGFVSYESIISASRDSRRSSRITILSEALEKYYDQNGEYPGCDAMTQTPAIVTGTTLKGLDSEVLAVPDAVSGTNSILALCADLTTDEDSFAYVGDGSDTCLTGAACSYYVLKYREEATGNTISVVSRRTASASGIAVAPSAPAIVVTLNGSNVLATITPVTCSPGTPEYGINSHTNEGTWGGYTTWSTDTTSTQVANEGIKYGYRAQARCYVNNFSYSTNTTGSEGTYIKSITTIPTTPTVTATTPNSTTTIYSWNTTSCPANTTPRYQYRYTISPSGSDSGWITTAGTTVSFTTSTAGQTYTVQIQSQCYSSYATGSWSGTGSASYYRPIPTVIAEAWGGGGGGCDGGGTPAGGETTTGGGGGGGYSQSTIVLTAGTGYSIVVGGGGGVNGNGADSYFINTSTLLAKAGTGGTGSVTGTGGQAASGVGTIRYSGGNGSFGDQGAAGGAAGPHGPGGNAGGDFGGAGDAGSGGGGGAGSTTNPANNGGDNAIGGGGGGGSENNGVGGTGGLYGGGGGAGEDYGGAGRQGKVVITYTTGTMSATGGTVATNGGNTIHTFTGSGTFTVY